jgi:hypothetical protein
VGWSYWETDPLQNVAQEESVSGGAGQWREQANRRAAPTVGKVEMVGVVADISFLSLLSIFVATFNKRVWSIRATFPTMATPPVSQRMKAYWAKRKAVATKAKEKKG